MSDRFNIWTDKSGGDRSETYCRDTVLNEETSRPGSDRSWIEEWMAGQVAKTEAMKREKAA